MKKRKQNFEQCIVTVNLPKLSKLGSNLIWNNEELNIRNDIAIEKLVEGIKRMKAVIPEFEPRKYVADKSLNEKTEPKDPVFSMMLHTEEEVPHVRIWKY